MTPNPQKHTIKVCWVGKERSLYHLGYKKKKKDSKINYGYWKHSDFFKHHEFSHKTDFQSFTSAVSYFLIYFYFMCKGVLPACVSIYYMPAVPVKAKRGHRIPRN